MYSYSISSETINKKLNWFITLILADEENKIKQFFKPQICLVMNITSCTVAKNNCIFLVSFEQNSDSLDTGLGLTQFIKNSNNKTRPTGLMLTCYTL